MLERTPKYHRGLSGAQSACRLVRILVLRGVTERFEFIGSVRGAGPQNSVNLALTSEELRPERKSGAE